MTMPPGTLRELRRLSALLDRAGELEERAAEKRREALETAGAVAAFLCDVRADNGLQEAERLRAEFAHEAADLWPLLMSYAEAWASERRWAA